MEVFVCPHCGQKHPANTHFCPSTGRQLTASKSLLVQKNTIALLGIVVLGVVVLLIADPFGLWNGTGRNSIRVSVLSSTQKPLITAIPSPSAEHKQELVLETTTVPAPTIPIREAYHFNTTDTTTPYPHWVNYIRSILELEYDSNTIYQLGLTVYTTLDPALQDEAQRLVTEQVALLADKNAKNGALVAIKPSTGEILAMVGSPDFNNDAISGQVNMANSPTRQPGTAIKPLIYLAAFEKGWTPATLIWDVPTEFPDGANLPYVPKNYDDKFHGPVTVRTALSNSFNIPAVKTLEFVGVYDDPTTPQKDGMIGMAERLGITSFTRPDYGLALTLGGGDVSLLDMTAAYSVFANGGKKVLPVAILKIVDFQGNMVYEYQPPADGGEQVIRPEHAFLISSILSDDQARSWMFGSNSLLNLPFQVAAKTGTTNEFRDNWTMGYTPNLVTGVWVGNADYTPMVNTTGLTGAAPIWSAFMQVAVPVVSNNSPTPFTIPSGITDRIICITSGTEPSQWCQGGQRSEYFASDQLPLPKEQDLWTKVVVDTWTNLRASSACGNFTQETFVLNITNPWAIRWIQETEAGQAWVQQMGFSKPIIFAPIRECRADDPNPKLAFVFPREGETITTSPLVIVAIADANQWFKRVWLEYGPGRDPDTWKLLTERDLPVKQPEEIYQWDLSEMPEGELTLRLYMQSTDGTYAEKRLYLDVHR